LEALPRFYLDDTLPRTTIENLAAEADVENENAFGLHIVIADFLDWGNRLPVLDQLFMATQCGCVLCTHDPDYVELAVSGVEHTGILFGHPQKHSPQDWATAIKLMRANRSAAEMRNRVEYL
jgi:hypothetical protein